MPSRSNKSRTNRSLQISPDNQSPSSMFKRKASNSDKPTPLDFDAFIPWVCVAWQVPEVVIVHRITPEKLSKSERRSSSGRGKSARSFKLKEEDASMTKNASQTVATTSTSINAENAVQIKAIYDINKNLTEINIDNCVQTFHRKVIQAINLCIPFHSFLTKFVFRKRGLNHILLYEIGKLLPFSNITDVWFEDTYVPEGNYYILLDYVSNLKLLSLKRCQINDEICKQLAARIDFGCPAEKSLGILDLSCNFITDVGAKYFGHILRRNRHLLHLNFLGNQIGDIGFAFLIKYLQAFSLSDDEIMDKKLRSFDYYRKRSELYDHFLEKIARSKLKESTKTSPRTPKLLKDKKPKKLEMQNETDPLLDTDLAEKMTRDIMGELIAPFNDSNCFRRDNNYYSPGNFRLCSLNVAYNNLEFISLIKILDVLKYQSLIDMSPPDRGLFRVVLEGNHLPNSCPELKTIDKLLKKATRKQKPTSPTMKRRPKR